MDTNYRSYLSNGSTIESHILRRNRTLNRSKSYKPTPLLTGKTREKKTCWVIFSRIITFWAPSAILSSIGGLQDEHSRQAWREKIALCSIALFMGAVSAFLTIGFSSVMCPVTSSEFYLRFNQTPGHLGILGWQFNVTNARAPPELPIFEILKNGNGIDISNYFTRRNQDIKSCVKGDLPNFKIVSHEPCTNKTQFCFLKETIGAESLSELNVFNTTRLVGYDWDQLESLQSSQNYLVIDGNVLNLEPYITTYPDPIDDDIVDRMIRAVLNSEGKDATRYFFSKRSTKAAADCIIDKYFAGKIDKQTIGCFVSDLFLSFSFVVIVGIVVTRFLMACFFDWFISPILALKPIKLQKPLMTKRNNANVARMMMNKIGNNLYCVLLVTCYSEGEEGIRATCESIAATDYPNSRKLLFLVCDGIITGSGNSKSTPDICVKMMELSPEFEAEAMSYVSVGAGAKQLNTAKVYAGHFCHKNKRVPMITVVKCGNNEQDQPKPGNRGKRDSQLILLNFFSRVTYNDRMSALDYDIFRKVNHLMGVTPDFFEVVLMVDADTKIYPDSLRLLVNCMCNDHQIMGLCGETRVANKRDSWVTAIQVFEYYISHHLGKAFESVFGGVTCLPGCFCMYRLKARKENDWIPIITNPEIIQEYSQNIVDTLHQKNLLLLGEDRFLSTLMLRNFPNRKMIFCPQAVCKTVVPDKFAVLLSQRRRWINSTIHNLMELVLIRNLCGTFCFSMQFVIFMELIGTVILPIAILLTYSLAVAYTLQPPKNTSEAIPLIILLLVLGLPAVLIIITTRKVVYIFWMALYLVALPVWNFILPVYAYWHFDDFSWGETRKVEGEDKDDHGEKDGLFDPTKVSFKRWKDWEIERIRHSRVYPYTNAYNLYYPSPLKLNPYHNNDSRISPYNNYQYQQPHHYQNQQKYYM